MLKNAAFVSYVLIKNSGAAEAGAGIASASVTVNSLDQVVAKTGFNRPLNF